jgi:hypothetical protein
MMMRIGFWFTVVVLALSAAGLPSSSADAGDRHLGKALAKEPFSDLPGVKAPSRDSQTNTVCTSSVERQRPTRWRNGLGYRVYRCDTEIFTFESNRPPNEIDWRKQQNRSKPWITDGF